MPKNKEQKKRVILLDAHAILHRAYHALPDFTSSKGEPTGALYGLSAMLIKIINELKPDYIISCYDLPEPTHRHEVYEDYKAGRAKTDTALVAQMDSSRDIFEVFGIPIYEKSGFEADDILGTIVEKLKNEKDIEIIIASGDMDTLQLVDKKRVKVFTLRKGINDTIMYDEKQVEERFGFKPVLLQDFKGLRGDPSDNIIGIAGIGEKTATTLIKKFGTIEKIYKELEKNEEVFEKAGIKPRIINLLKEGKEEAEFSKILATIRRDAPITFSLPKKKWEESFDINKVLELFDELSFRTLGQRVRTLFGPKNETLDLNHKKEEKEETVDESELKKVALGLWILNSDTTNPELDDILQFSKTKSFKEAKKIIEKEIQKQKLGSVYEGIEIPLIPVVEKMFDRGIVIDLEYLKNLSKEYHKELSKHEEKIWKHAGGEFNINSPKQLAEILFEKMNLVVKNQKKTSTGQKSTRESELEKMKDLHPIIEEILSYRELQKLLSTYIDNVPHMVDKEGRLHATFSQAGTTTGRMSSNNPNLQNIPIRTELGKKIRNAFVSSRGFKLVTFDYSQIELRVAAFLSGDTKLLHIFKKGGDVHTAVASEVFGVKSEKVDSEMRRRAKVINFGILYGMGVNALRQNLGTSREEAQEFLSNYFKTFNGLALYMDKIKAQTKRKGYTETFFGRKRYFPGIKSSLPFIRAQAERMAINAPIQGTEADIIKVAMTRVDEYLLKEGLEKDAYLLLQVHDELVYEIKNDKVDEISKKIQTIMESVLTLKETKGVKLDVDVAVGNNWGVMKNQ